MDNPHTGYEAYCCGHSSGANLSGVDGNPRIAVFPAGFTTEAAALGGRVRTTSTGFTTVEPVIETLAALRCLPPLNEQPPIKRILEQIAATTAGQIPLLQANAPYSALAPLVPPALLYRWLAKHPACILAALEHITTGLAAYINAAFAAGARILSLADPFATNAALGTGRRRTFAAEPLARLLTAVQATAPAGRIIHLCPQASLPLEHCGLVTSRPRPTTGKAAAYTTLLAREAPAATIILGHQCIHAQEASRLVEVVF